MNTENSPLKGKRFHFIKQHTFFFYNCSFYREEEEVRMKRCVEVVTMAVKHLFVDCLVPSHCSKSCMRVDRVMNLDPMRDFDGCGGC